MNTVNNSKNSALTAAELEEIQLLEQQDAALLKEDQEAFAEIIASVNTPVVQLVNQETHVLTADELAAVEAMRRGEKLVAFNDADLLSIEIGRAAKPVLDYIADIIRTGAEFKPSKLFEVGESYASLVLESKQGFDPYQDLAYSLIGGIPSLVSTMATDNPTEAEIEAVQFLVGQMDAARDAFLAAQVRSYQETTAATPVIDATPSETEQAREANKGKVTTSSKPRARTVK